jgi:hypothetical protein
MPGLPERMRLNEESAVASHKPAVIFKGEFSANGFENN